VINYGKTVSVAQFKKASNGRYSDQNLRNRLAELHKQGWLIRLKRGQYLVITDISSLGSSDESDYVIAQTILKDSYVSFENALQYHGMFDQSLTTVDSVTLGHTRKQRVEGNKLYRFSHVKGDLYTFGVVEVRIGGRLVHIAKAEKALLDMLYFRSNSVTTSLVREKLQEYRNQIDFKKLKQYATRYSVSIVRQVGFLLDAMQINTDDLHKSAGVKGNTYTKMAGESLTFNARWRLYYDSKLN
jgi:predicted transcriptional regulator of viral defense system